MHKTFTSEFARDVWQGLTDSPKWLSSKYFYDSRGDMIFRQIMKMKEYYLTDCELEIFETYHEEVLKAIGVDPFRIVELGAGDGQKTKSLLREFYKSHADFTYAPCDISANVLAMLQASLRDEIPELEVELMHGDYFKVLSDLLRRTDGIRNIVFFLGSNIGNFTPGRALEFLKRVRQNLHKGDLMMIGFDLKKNSKIILDAYDDPAGITASFNYNLLARINEELGADFDCSKFSHTPQYHEDTGECKSYLVSDVDQEVSIKDIDVTLSFDKGEQIFMEVSKKYAPEEIILLAEEAGFCQFHFFQDQRGYFEEALWEAV